MSDCNHPSVGETRIDTSQIILHDGRTCRQSGVLIQQYCKNFDCGAILDRRYEWNSNGIECPESR
jgi:hypothetical protein